MLKYYNIPGKLLAEFWFLWSKKGELWGSARRREHPFVHFAYSTMIYVATAFAAYVALTDWKLPRREKQNQSGYLAAVEPSQAGMMSPTEDKPEMISEKSISIRKQDVLDPVLEQENQDTAASSPGPDSAIKSAMTAAFESGQPARWETAGNKGYAVASEAEASSGCRQVHYSDESRPGWTSSPETMCP